MSKYAAPIKLEANYNASSMVDANGKFVELTDIARDLTAYYELLAKQAECGKTGHVKEVGDGITLRHCCKCGADLTKGATHG